MEHVVHDPGCGLKIHRLLWSHACSGQMREGFYIILDRFVALVVESEDGRMRVVLPRNTADSFLKSLVHETTKDNYDQSLMLRMAP